MKNRSVFKFMLVILFVQYSAAISQGIPIKNGIQLENEELCIKVQFYTNDIVRIVKWDPEGKPEKLSLSVIKNELNILDIDTQVHEEEIILSSEKLKLRISKTDLQITCFTKDNGILLKEIQSDFESVVYEEDSAFHVQQNFQLTPDEGLYGLGQHQTGYMNYRGKIVKLVQTNTDAVNSFLISTNHYGLLWDNYSKTTFTDNEDGTSFWSDVGDNMDYYLIHGKNMDEIIAGYRILTGQAPMYGKYAYGYWQSKEHYDTQDEIMGVAREYRKRKIPIDNMIQDWDYWNGRENWSGMFFDKTLFPRPKEMVDELHEMNFHLIISIWPALGPNTAIYREMDQKNFLYPPVGWGGFKYYDAFNPDANQVYWKYLKEGLFSKGIDGWWIDSTEPDVINALTKESTEYEMKKLGRNDLGTWARYLNGFSISMTDALYQNLRRATDKRAYILTRSTFAGQQRNAATTWSGDIGANWDIYKKQIAAGINHCMSGIPYWTFDIGGFVIGAYEGVFNKGGKDPAYQELYTRMFQFGAFSPIFRSHGSETPREIWEMGEFVEPIIQYDNLRYRFMPYIYSLAWKVNHEGYTIMRGLPMDFSTDKNTYAIDDQFMFGPAVMVCPVTEYMIHRPPEKSVIIGSEYFQTHNEQPGLNVKYYKDPEYRVLTKEQIEPNVNMFWYTGRPDFVTDSAFAIRWEGKLIPKETGQYQFHMKSFDAKRIKINGDELPIVYTSVEQLTDLISLKAGKAYDFVLETENRSSGAARMRLFWKTPNILKKEKTIEKREKTRPVYLPSGTQWIDFWTGNRLQGGQQITANAPIEILPLFIKAGSMIPMGPFIQYTTEKPANPIELRIYTGADGHFTLYEDENEYHHYEKGIYATIRFNWIDASRKLMIEKRKGTFPGMLEERSFHVIFVKQDHGTGLEITDKPDKIILYDGQKQIIEF